MGYIRHNAIVATTWDRHGIDAAATEARRIGLHVLGPDVADVNDWFTICIPPDGSKEGWEESDQGDEKRAAFRTWLASKVSEDGGYYFEWCEVAYGNDDMSAEIVRSTWTEDVGTE